MTDILLVKNIQLNQNMTNQEEVFGKIAQLAVENGYAESMELVKEGLILRENEGSTGMMDGIGIPHCQSTTIKKPGVFIMKTTNGIEWNSMDGEPVNFVVSLLIPKDEAGTTHLKMLSTIARMLMKEDIKKALLEAQQEEIILDILLTHLKGE